MRSSLRPYKAVNKRPFAPVLVVYIITLALLSRIIYYAATCKQKPQYSYCIEGEKASPYFVYNYIVNFGHVYFIDAVTRVTRSPYQIVETYISKFWGTILVIDKDLMTTTRDESHYHEMIAHVPLAYIPGASTALVIGGGDGGTLQQMIKHTTLHATLVDIDRAVISLSKKYLPHLRTGFDSSRSTVINAEGAGWIKKRKAEKPPRKFNVIAVDSTDYGQATTLFTDAFYSDLKDLLKPGGIIVRNIDSGAVGLHSLQKAYQHYSEMFKHVYFFNSYISTYISGHYSFVFLSDDVHPFNTKVDWSRFTPDLGKMKYYSKETHYACFVQPAFVQAIMNSKLEWAQLSNSTLPGT